MEACFANRLESGRIRVAEIAKIVISYTLHSGYKGRDPTGVSLCAVRSQPESDGGRDIFQASNYQGLVKVERWLYTNMLDSMFPFVAQYVEPQAVFVRFD